MANGGRAVGTLMKGRGMMVGVGRRGGSLKCLERRLMGGEDRNSRSTGQYASEDRYSKTLSFYLFLIRGIKPQMLKFQDATFIHRGKETWGPLPLHYNARRYRSNNTSWCLAI